MSHTIQTKSSILETIGNTPIVKLQRVAAGCNAHFYAKCEFMNPGGSIKDRIGVHMIDTAEQAGQLKPGGTIVEATSGNTGVGLAMAAAIRGYKCICVMADKQSEDKRTLLKSLGAQVVVCPTNVEATDSRSYYEVAKRLAKEIPNAFHVNQYANPKNPETHYLTTGPEIWNAFGKSLGVLVATAGTGGTLVGIAKYLKEQNRHIQIVGVDPIGSIYYDLFHTGVAPAPQSYSLEGFGEDFMPDTMDLSVLDDMVQVGDEESFSMAKRLIAEEGLLCGGSSGAAVLGAMRYIEKQRFSDAPHILVVLPDSASRYMSKFLGCR